MQPSNDVFVFQVNASLEFTDIRIDGDENLLDNIPNIHVKDGIKMINNNTNYTIPFTGYANLCALCEINATVGWQLWNHNYSEMLEEYMRRMAAEVKKRYLLSWSAVWGIVRFYGPMSLKLFMAERCQVHMPERLSVDTRRDLPDSLLKSSSNE